MPRALSPDTVRALGEAWGCYSMNAARHSMVSNSLLRPTAETGHLVAVADFL